MKKNLLFAFFVLLCVVIFASVSNAEMDLGLRGIGGEVSYVIPDYAGDNTFGLGVVADLGTILPILRAEGSISYWGKSWDAGYYEWGWTTITIGGIVKYDVPLGCTTGSSFIPFVGGGPALVITRWSSDWKGTNNLFGLADVNTSATNTDIQLQAVAGVDVPVSSKTKLTVQAKYGLGGNNTLWLTLALMVALY